jgi:hypothetical protein
MPMPAASRAVRVAARSRAIKHFTMDISDIRRAVLDWKSSQKVPLHECLAYAARLAQDNSYTVTSTLLDGEIMEVRLSTAEVSSSAGRSLVRLRSAL